MLPYLELFTPMTLSSWGWSSIPLGFSFMCSNKLYERAQPPSVSVSSVVLLLFHFDSLEI